jgi:hypothetical protein
MMENFAGAIFGLEGIYSVLLLEKCYFSSINNTGICGAIFYNSTPEETTLSVLSTDVNIRIMNCTFASLTSCNGSAIYIAGVNTLPMMKCYFVDNVATTSLGGNDVYGSLPSVYQSVLIFFFFVDVDVFVLLGYLSDGMLIMCCSGSGGAAFVVVDTDYSSIFIDSCVGSVVVYLASLDNALYPGSNSNTCDITSPCLSIAHVLNDNTTVFILECNFLTIPVNILTRSIQLRAINKFHHTTIQSSPLSASNTPLFSVTTGYLRFEDLIFYFFHNFIFYLLFFPQVYPICSSSQHKQSRRIRIP